MAYALRPPILCVLTTASAPWEQDHTSLARAAAAGGADLVQLRAPELDDSVLATFASELTAVCHEHGSALVVNDRLEVAAEARADGVHLGADDGDLASARARLGPAALLGASVSTPEDALRAEEAGADYLGVTVWGSPSKRDAEPVGLEGLEAVCAATSRPVLAIGGVNGENTHRVIAHGASGIAVIRAVAEAPDPVAATRGLRARLQLLATHPDTKE